MYKALSVFLALALTVIAVDKVDAGGGAFRACGQQVVVQRQFIQQAHPVFVQRQFVQRQVHVPVFAQKQFVRRQFVSPVFTQRRARLGVARPVGLRGFLFGRRQLVAF